MGRRTMYDKIKLSKKQLADIPNIEFLTYKQFLHHYKESLIITPDYVSSHTMIEFKDGKTHKLFLNTFKDVLNLKEEV